MKDPGKRGWKNPLSLCGNELPASDLPACGRIFGGHRTKRKGGDFSCQPGERLPECAGQPEREFVIHRSGWGHLRLEIEAKGRLPGSIQKVVTDQDFIGSVYQVEYVIHRNLLGKGNCRGEIRIKSPYQTLVFSVEASLGAGDGINRALKEKQHKIALTKDYLDYRCGTITLSEWTSNARYELNELFETGFDYPEYHIYDAYLQHMQGEDEKAREILKTYQNKVFARKSWSLPVCICISAWRRGFIRPRTGRAQNPEFLYAEGRQRNPFVDSSAYGQGGFGSFAKALFLMEELFDRGCRSPLLYLEAWETLGRGYFAFAQDQSFLDAGIFVCRQKRALDRRALHAVCISVRL